MDRAGRPATDDSTATDASTPTDGSTATGESPADNSPSRDDGARPASSLADDSPAGDDGARPAGSAGGHKRGCWRRAAAGAAAAPRAARHLALLACYLAAGNRGDLAACAATAPGPVAGDDRDVASYVWDLWWVPHQLVRLGNPWFTAQMAAPVGIQLGYDTTMPLVGMIMSPVTLAFGPAVSFSLLTIVMPGLLCYVMYRAARLWLRSQAGAIAAGAFFGLSSMLAEQDWTHLNIVAGTLFLPMTVEAAVRLRRVRAAARPSSWG